MNAIISSYNPRFRSEQPSYFLFAKFSCTIPPILPSALKCCPIAPCLSSGPPTFCAVPPIAPSAAEALVSLYVSCMDMSDLPLNMDPTAPCLSNTLVPVPPVFSPSAGCMKISSRALHCRRAKSIQSASQSHVDRSSSHSLSRQSWHPVQRSWLYCRRPLLNSL